MEDDDALGAGGVEEPEDEAAAAPITSQVHALGSGAGNTLSVRTYDCYITYDKFHQVPRMWLSGLSPSRQPLTTAEIFQDIAGDYAQKTVTIEPFPHRENVTMASVHPCKHANVMKKVIERMNGAVREQQRRDRAAAEGEILSPGATPASPEAAAKKKKGWGIPSAVKKAAGVGSSSASGAGAGASAIPAEEDVEGLRVDQCEYRWPHRLGSEAHPSQIRLFADLLVFLKFMSNVVPTIELDATTSL
jgi:ubiquitin-like-conjugating enzyme ATG3